MSVATSCAFSSEQVSSDAWQLPQSTGPQGDRRGLQMMTELRAVGSLWKDGSSCPGRKGWRYSMQPARAPGSLGWFSSGFPVLGRLEDVSSSFFRRWESRGRVLRRQDNL